MSTEPTIDVTTEDNLDNFAAELFGKSQPPSDTAKSEEEEIDDNVEDDATNEETDTQPSAEEDGATEESEDSEENPETKDEDDKGKKPNRLQERINELTAARRQAERERDEALRKLNEKPTDPKPNTKAQETTVNDEGPKATDKNEDGTDKYPLGEFDPKFVKDTVQHMVNEQAREAEAKREEQAKLTEEEKYRETLQNSWNERLEVAQDRYPDYQEKGEQMLSVFEGIDPTYGQYLTDTLMEMDAGPDVFYYLANNLDEAEQIVNAGPRKATIALAKLEVQLAGTPTPKTPAVKATKAPPPPPQNKGSAVAAGSIPLDTDDLDAFSKVLFKKK